MKYSLNFAMLKLVLHSDSSQLHLYLYLIQISCINICFWNKEQNCKPLKLYMFHYSSDRKVEDIQNISICQILYNLNIISLSILNDDESLEFSFFIFQIQNTGSHIIEYDTHVFLPLHLCQESSIQTIEPPRP